MRSSELDDISYLFSGATEHGSMAVQSHYSILQDYERTNLFFSTGIELNESKYDNQHDKNWHGNPSSIFSDVESSCSRTR